MQFIVNNWYLILGIVVVLAMLAWGPLTQLLHGVQHVTTAEAIRLLNHEKGLLVDVREPDEYRGGHIPNALNLPLSGLAAGLKQIEKHKGAPAHRLLPHQPALGTRRGRLAQARLRQCAGTGRRHHGLAE